MDKRDDADVSSDETFSLAAVVPSLKKESSSRDNANMPYNLCSDLGSTKSKIVRGIWSIEVVGFTTLTKASFPVRQKHIEDVLDVNCW